MIVKSLSICKDESEEPEILENVTIRIGDNCLFYQEGEMVVCRPFTSIHCFWYADHLEP